MDEGDLGHFHGCTSYQAFLEKSYFCDTCNRGYDHEDFAHHPCEGRRCKSCKTVECGPKDHHPTRYCMHCNRYFYNERCMQLHISEKTCETLKRCPTCCKEYTPSLNYSHECYVSRCRSCGEEEDLRDHKCYIQPVEEEEDLPKKKPKTLYNRQKKKNPDVNPYFEPPIMVFAD